MKTVNSLLSGTKVDILNTLRIQREATSMKICLSFKSLKMTQKYELNVWYTITQQASNFQTFVLSVEDHYVTAFGDKPYSTPNPISHDMEMRLVKIYWGFSGSLVRPLSFFARELWVSSERDWLKHQGASYTSWLRWQNPVVILSYHLPCSIPLPKLLCFYFPSSHFLLFHHLIFFFCIYTYIKIKHL